MYDVLDPYDADAPAAQLTNGLYQLAGFSIRKATADFIEQQDFGARGQGAGQLQSFAIQQSNSFSLAICNWQHSAEFQGLISQLVTRLTRQGRTMGSGNVNVFKHRHAKKGQRNLVSLGKPPVAAVSSR